MKIYLAGHWRTPWREHLMTYVTSAEWLLPIHPDEPDGLDSDCFVPRDLAMVRKSDLVVALISNEARNIGTCTEIAYAYGLGIPCVLIDLCESDSGFVFQRKMATTVVHDLDKAARVVQFISKPAL